MNPRRVQMGIDPQDAPGEDVTISPLHEADVASTLTDGDMDDDAVHEWTPTAALQAVGGCSRALSTMGGPLLSSLGVASWTREDGSATVAIAAAHTQRVIYGRRSVLLELDIVSSALTRQLGLGGQPGLASAIRGDGSIESSLHWVDHKLAVLVAGDFQAEPVHAAGRVLRSEIVRELTMRFDVVVALLPPLGESALAAELAGMCEKVLLVARDGKTALSNVRQAANVLGGSPPVLLTKSPPAGPKWLHRLSGGER